MNDSLKKDALDALLFALGRLDSLAESCEDDSAEEATVLEARSYAEEALDILKDC